MADIEITVGRAPVQIVEIQTSRCANSFGCGACEAGLGVVSTGDGVGANFALEGLTTSWVGSNATLSRINGGINMAATGASPHVEVTGATGFDGDDFRYVTVCGRYNAGDLATLEMWYDSGSGFAASRSMSPVNENLPFRGLKQLSDLQPGQNFVLVFDASDSTNYAADWQGSTVTGLRLLFGSASSDDIDIFSVSIGDQSLYAAKGSECYNTRSSCSDLDNFRASVDGHLVPSLSAINQDALANANFTTNENAFFVLHGVRFDTNPEGCIFEVGGTTQGVYMGVTNSELVFRFGSGVLDKDPDSADVRVPVSLVAGRTVSLIGEIDFDADTANLWEFDAVTRNLTKLGTSTITGTPPSVWADSGDGGVGYADTPMTGESASAFTGNIRFFRYYGGSLFDARADEVWRLNEYFGRNQMEKPGDDIQIAPLLDDVSTAPTRVSLAGSDRNATPLGNRASVRIRMSEAPSGDLVSDPYRSDRLINPIERTGHYWARWMSRHRIGKTSGQIRVYEGYAGQLLSDMNKREYVLDHADVANRQSFQIRGRDILTRAELAKAQVPAASRGQLNANINGSVTTFTIKNAELSDYPTSGTVKIDKEIITYTGRALNGGDPTLVDFTGLTRGTDRSTATGHDADDTVQLCRRYTDASVSEVLIELLADDAGIPAQNLNIVGWEAEDAAQLTAYSLTTLITNPTSVSRLAGELAETAPSLIWWDERIQKVELKALGAVSVQPGELTDRNGIVRDSLTITEKPKELATRVQVFYNPISFAEELRDPTDFLNAYIDTDVDLEQDDATGVVQVRTILTRWLTTRVPVLQTASRLASRYQEVPREVTLSIDRSYDTGDGSQVWIGSVVILKHFQIVDEFGDYDTSRFWICTSAEEIEPGETVRCTFEDATLAGFQAQIAADNQPDFVPGETTFIAFIGNNSGKLSDGTDSAKIQ